MCPPFLATEVRNSENTVKHNELCKSMLEYYKGKPHDCNIHYSEVNIVIYPWFLQNCSRVNIAGKMKMTSLSLRWSQSSNLAVFSKCFITEGNSQLFKHLGQESGISHSVFLESSQCFVTQYEETVILSSLW